MASYDKMTGHVYTPKFIACDCHWQQAAWA